MRERVDRRLAEGTLVILIVAGLVLPSPLTPVYAPASGPVIQRSFFAMTLGKAATVTTWPLIGTLGKDNSEDWRFIEKSSGTINWAPLDADMATARAHGVNSFIYTLLETPVWASPSGAANAVPNVADLDSFLQALVTRYKGQIEYYELWNEPNNPKSWSGTVQDMLNLAESAYPLIKSIDPNAIVLTPGVAVAGVEPISGQCVRTCWLAQYLEAGGGNYADAISWHAYRCQSGQYGDCGSGIGCTEVIQCAGQPILTQIDFIKSYMTRYGLASEPILDTEGGWGQNQYLTDANQQAAYISRWYILQASEGIRVATWYAWNGDTPSDPAGWGTLWTQAEGESEAARAYNQTYSWLIGSTMSGPCSLSGGLWTCPLTQINGNEALLAFADSNSSEIAYSPPSDYVQYQDLNGNTFPIHGQIDVNMKPILLQAPPVTSTTSVSEFINPATITTIAVTAAATFLSKRKDDSKRSISRFQRNYELVRETLVDVFLGLCRRPAKEPRME